MAANYGNGMGPGMPMQQQQMQQMQQPMPMQGMHMGPPQGAMPPPRPVRRGTSKAVPIVMSAGLAVGVFCGLLFGLGTGNDGAFASPTANHSTSTSADTKGSDQVADVLKTPTAADGTAKKADATPATKIIVETPPVVATAGSDAGSAAPATGSGATTGSAAPATGSGTGSAAVAVAVVAPPGTGSGATPSIVSDKDGLLKVSIVPANSGAKITVDGKDFTPDTVIALGGAAKKTVTVSVKAGGFHEWDQKVDVSPGSPTTVQVELVKRGGGTTATATAQGGTTPTGAKSNGNGGNTRPTWTGTQTIPAGGTKSNGNSGTKSNGSSGGTKSNGNSGTKSTGTKSTGLIDI